MNIRNTSKDLKILKQMIVLSEKHNNQIPIEKLNEFDSFFVDRLRTKDYFRYLNQDSWGGNPDSFEVTDEGMNAPYFAREEFKDFLLQSVIVPVGVSVITTVIVILIEKFLL